MGFFCYKCGKKVRGQPIKHGCTRRGGMPLQRKIYAAKRAVKEYNQARSAGLNPKKPRCMRRREERNSKCKNPHRNRLQSDSVQPWNEERFHYSAYECRVCGCSSEFDSVGDRICGCSSCFMTG
mmetsp:Transcript_2891/g.6822  ORF Transcript_2891/g.6822 Transcript_2891/m.6822 type:complete len:124 (+) Transcript_2891:107-478(+)